MLRQNFMLQLSRKDAEYQVQCFFEAGMLRSLMNSCDCTLVG